MNEPIRVLIADDQPLLRHSLRLIVDGADGLIVVGEACTGEDAIAQARSSRPDVILMDIRMPGGDGIDATRQIAADPNLGLCRVLILTMFDLDEYVMAALRAGASGFLLKDAEPSVLVEGIRRTHAGESLFAPAILARLVVEYLDRPVKSWGPGSGQSGSGRSGSEALPLLTEREREVLTLVGRGFSNQEIMAALVISQGTVKTHIGNLLAKLHARDRAQLVIAAYEARLVAPQ